jgi:ATP-dependent helicase/nuclease subunit B
VLQHFHEGRKAQSLPRAAEVERAALDASAQAVTTALGLDRAGFVPFSAAWPQLRDGYLRWLLDHEGVCGGRFVAAEQKRQVAWQRWQLSGTLDRMDEATRDGRTVGLLIDYKTESLKATRDRVRPGSEDLQLAFYAALVQGDPVLADRPVVAAYLNVGERGDTEWVEQEDVVALRDRLLAGLAHDLQRIQDGHVLPALGEGPVCDHCTARGLCRKDAWA